jgi:hypothetical protein
VDPLLLKKGQAFEPDLYLSGNWLRENLKPARLPDSARWAKGFQGMKNLNSMVAQRLKALKS